MIRPGVLTLYGALAARDAAIFEGELPRLVRLAISAPEPVAVSVHHLDEAGEPDPEGEFFAFKTDGMEDVEFHVPGPFALIHSGERAIYLHCKDGEVVSFDPVDAETFTTLYERRPTNPEVERLQEVLLANQNRRMAAMYADIERERASLEAQRTALDQRASAPSVDPAPAEPVKPSGEPAKVAGAPPLGEAGGVSDSKNT